MGGNALKKVKVEMPKPEIKKGPTLLGAIAKALLTRIN